MQKLQGKQNLNQALSYCSSFVEDINDTLLQIATTSGSSLIGEITSFIVNAGGKRIRPCQMFLSYGAAIANFEAAGLRQSKHLSHYANLVKCGAVVELIHTASLLHDDIIDEATKRRGKKTANTIWGNKEVILVGDYLFAKSFEIIAELGNQNLVKLLAKACLNLTSGEVKQLTIRSQITASLEEYGNIIYQKTASLFECSSQIGSLVAALSFDADASLASPASIALGNFGRLIGNAFQITDDILDYAGKSKDLGKQIGKDFLEGKITLPIILAINDSRELYDIFNSKSFTEANFDKTLQILQRTNAINKAKSIALQTTDDAKNAIANLAKGGEAWQILNELADELASRNL